MKRAWAIVGALLLAAACDSGPPKPVDVRFDLAWYTQGVALGDGRATFTSDTGYVIELDRLEVTTYSVELMPCEPLPRKQSGLSLIGTAWAGHQSGHPPTRTNAAGFEAPLKTTVITMDKIAVPDVAYCAAHYLIGRLLDPPPGADPAAASATTGFSLRLHGRYRKTDGEAWTDLDLDSPVAHGILVNFTDPKNGARLKSGDAVRVTRKLAPIFDGVDFGAMDPAAQVRQILRQIVSSTVVSWHTAG